MKLRNYTVLLLRPDYVASYFGHDTFCARVKALTAAEALVLAQQEACRTDEICTLNRDDYYCLSCTVGWRKDFVDGGGGVL